jgi:hypothetical protein
MNNSATLDSARHFLTTVWDGEVPTDKALLAALDRLIETYHHTPEEAPSDSDLEPPRSGGPQLYAEVGQRFSSYGLYPKSDPADPPDAAVALVGDAIDDLADLTLDMREVVWLGENIGLADAHWFFRLQYSHWGRHARELALYLHAREFG